MSNTSELTILMEKIHRKEEFISQQQRELESLRETAKNIPFKDQMERSYEAFRGRLCLFWDTWTTPPHGQGTRVPAGGIIRFFSRAEYRNGILRYYASDICTGSEVMHGWKNFRVIRRDEILQMIDVPGRRIALYPEFGI
jgi:hypothetical protein